MSSESHLREAGLSWSFRKIKDLLVETYSEWSAAEAARMGAALAYYTMLSIAPLLILIIGVASLAWDEAAVRGELAIQLEGFIGRQGADTVQALIRQSNRAGGGVLASAVGLLTLLLGATSVVAELRSSVNKLWKVQERRGLTSMLRQRLYAFGIILIAGALLLTSMLVGAAAAVMGAFFANLLPVHEWVLQTVNFGISLAFVTLVFAILFKALPNEPLGWHDVLPGSAFTAFLFTVGKTAIGLYLGKAGFTSTFGAAGSLVLVLVWVYYSAQLFFFGAEFTRVYANRYGAGDAKRISERGLRADNVTFGWLSR